MPNPRQDESSATGFKAVDKAAEAAEAAVRDTAQAAQSEARSFTDRAASDAREATDAAGEVARTALGAAGQAIPDPEAVSRATEAVAARMRELSSEWVQAFRDQTARSLENFSRLAECRTPLDFVRLQSELTRQNVQDSVALARRLNSASLRAWGAIAQDSAKAATSQQQQPPAR
jgi:hypothetical protein